jgi:hypothetical protein
MGVTGVDRSDIRIERGTWDDYARLSAWHYLAAEPAVPELVLRAEMGGAFAGVLVLARPTLNGWWRDRAWPGRYTARRGGPNRAEAAQRLNADVRTLARVVVDPRVRACGLATALVRWYLARPLTKRTEAVAAMGVFCPFFARAGMREITAPPDRRGAALAAWLSARGIGPVDLIDADRATRALARPGVEDHLRRWCLGSVATRRLADAERTLLAASAAARAFAQRRAYVAERT